MPSTLSADAKDALAHESPAADHCRGALRSGLVLYGAASDGLTFRTQRLAVARLLRTLLDEPDRQPIVKRNAVRLTKAAAYELTIAAGQTLPRRPTRRCDRRMEIRAAFLACGSLATPARGYHLEFYPPDETRTERLAALLRADGRHPKLARRGGRPLVYFKDIDEIAEVLTSIGAFGAVLHLEDVRALKETKNRIRRLVNTEAANVERAATAAARQREHIALLAETRGLARLTAVQREVAELRLAHPSDTLAELGRRCRPPVDKATVNSRISAVLRIAGRAGSGGLSAPLHKGAGEGGG
jgi:DNA-binding transcriptional regulator WhiA